MDEVAVFRSIRTFLIRWNLSFELVKFTHIKIKAIKWLQKVIAKTERVSKG